MILRLPTERDDFTKDAREKKLLETAKQREESLSRRNIRDGARRAAQNKDKNFCNIGGKGCMDPESIDQIEARL